MLSVNDPIAAFILDLDGTMYRGAEVVPGAPEFVGFLKRHSIPYCFVTNRANRTPSEVDSQLQELGIPSAPELILTSAQATAAQLTARRIYCIGEAALVTELERTGNVITDDKPDTVVVGLDRFFTYDKLLLACRFISKGARYIATNPDKALDTAEGPRPGTGAFIAAIECVTGKLPEIIGKPEPAIMMEAARHMNLPPSQLVALGDNLATDVPAGTRAGMRTAWLAMGQVTPAPQAGPQPSWTLQDYKELTNIVALCNGLRL